MRKEICAAIIQHGYILLVRKKEIWVLPGGKPKTGEVDIQYLLREIRKELPMLNLQNLKHFDSFFGKAPHTGDKLRVKVYFAEAIGEIIPGAEINRAKWTGDPEKYNLSGITQKIIFSLRQDGYL